MALVALIIGIVGLYSLRNVGRSFHEVSDVNMPSVRYLLELETGFENLNGAFRTMLNHNLSAQERARQHRIIADARTRFCVLWLMGNSYADLMIFPKAG